MLEKSTYSIDLKRRVAVLPGGPIAWGSSSTQQPAIDSLSTPAAETNATNTQPQGIISWQTPFEINVVVWNTSTPSGQYTVYTMQNDGTNTFTYTASSNAMCIQIRQAGTYYLDNIRMYRTYEDTIFVRGYEVDRAYRYAFNGYEGDPEVKGTGNSYTTEFWQYDSRLGRRWNIDPVVKSYESPYATFANNPIWFIDPNGADTALTTQSRELILDLLNTESENYNEKFALDFQKLVDDESTVYSFDQWDNAKNENLGNGRTRKTFGEFSGQGKNASGQNLVTIGYSLESSSQGHKLDALFEEFDHAHQFLNQRIGFINTGIEWEVIGYDYYDEVDNKIGRVSYLNSFTKDSKYKITLYGTNSKILKSNFSKKVAERIVNLNYSFQNKLERNVFEAFDEPSKIKQQFDSGVRWDNIMIGKGTK